MAEKKYGEQLRGVIEHIDETFRHVHFYIVPKSGQRFESIDFGRMASKKASDNALTKGEQNNAYKVAMRRYQDNFFSSVGMKNGLARIGPGRRRLNRVQWRQEQKQALSLKSALAAAAETFQDAESVKASALELAASSLIVKHDLEKFSEVLLNCEKRQSGDKRKLLDDKRKLKSAYNAAKKNGFEAGIVKSKKIGQVVGDVLGALSLTIKKWWYSVTKPAPVGQDFINRAMSDTQKAELNSSQARTDTRRALAREQSMIFELVELKRQVREFETELKKDTCSINIIKKPFKSFANH
jgi:hypothetical protein